MLIRHLLYKATVITFVLYLTHATSCVCRSCQSGIVHKQTFSHCRYTKNQWWVLVVLVVVLVVLLVVVAMLLLLVVTLLVSFGDPGVF